MANETTNNYKRTVAGSIGAGVGAIFNGSGRTYYILEHKTSSRYHQAGESQKIIIDQIELGRDPSCQVRFDAETVSRKHAAIVRDGQNWQLIHLSQSNPTLVNGRPIQGHYYLQSGDEIQLSMNGPRLGFIVPQGKQALTSSIKLTERMNLFRQQALAPYRRAIWILSTLLLLSIIGFGIWTYMLNKDLEEQKEKALALQEQVDAYDKQITELESVAVKTPELEKQIVDLRNRKQQVVNSYRTIIRNNPELEAEVQKLRDQLTEGSTAKAEVENEKAEPEKETEKVAANPDSRNDLRDYYPHIYRIIIEEITLERNGVAHSAGLSTENKDCGTGFILSNGTFVTARQNVQPWLYVGGSTPRGWRYDLAKYVAMGFEVKMKFSAYSTQGPSQKIEISSRDFDLPSEGDVMEATVPISKSDWKNLQNLGFEVTKEDLKRVGTNIKFTTSRGRSYALYRGTGRSGIPANSGAAQSLPGGKDIEICGYTSNDVHNLASSAEYHKASTSSSDTKYGTIRIQNAPSYAGHLGAPAFIKEDDGSYSIIGVYVGNSQIVPINKCR